MNEGEIRDVISKTRFNGPDMPAGIPYAKLPAPFDNIVAYRNIDARLSFMKRWWPTDAKVVLDLGCNAGHYCFSLEHEGLATYAVGVDSDGEAIGVARMLAPFLSSKSSFWQEDVMLYEFSGVDVVLHLSLFQWIVQKYGITTALEHLEYLSRKCRTMFFETSGSDSKAPLPQADDYFWIERVLKEAGWHPEVCARLPCETGTERFVFKCRSSNC